MSMCLVINRGLLHCARTVVVAYLHLQRNFLFRSSKRVLSFYQLLLQNWFFFAEDRLPQKVHFWLYIVARYMLIMLNLNKGIVRVEFECPCCGLPKDDRIHAHYDRTCHIIEYGRNDKNIW